MRSLRSAKTTRVTPMMVTMLLRQLHQWDVHVAVPIVPYSVDDILKDGCFLERNEIDRLLDRLRTKKNLILQGPPGTGKTWLAKRLAFALMGQKDESKVRAVQFHPNLSYEDFVRGWRPTGEGKLSLADGVFMEAIKAASKDPSSKFVVVIEEINRGNPAQIFGELLTLLEAGKRTPNEALELCYPDADGKRRPVHIPENLYVVGTMNIADRSLALGRSRVASAFRLRGLEPRLRHRVAGLGGQGVCCRSCSGRGYRAPDC
jgi:5-methylcytosine-specific restriction protein B